MGFDLTKRLIGFVLLFVLLSVKCAYSESNFFTLRRAIDTAIHNNYLIKGAEQQIKVSYYSFRVATKSLLPSIEFNYSATRLKDVPYSVTSPAKIPVFGPNGIPNGDYIYFPGGKSPVGSKTSVEWSVELVQPVFMGFALITKRELAAVGVDVARVEKRIAVLNVAEKVKMTYFNVLLAERELDVAREQVKQLRAHERDAEMFYKQGLIAYNDLLKSRVALANAVQFEAQAGANLRIAISKLNVLLSRDINLPVKLRDVGSVPYGRYSLRKLIGYALLHRPQLESLRLKLKEAHLYIKLAESNYYPHISMFASYSQSGQNMLASSNELSNQHNEMVGLKIQWTIFDWFKTSDEVQEAKFKKASLLDSFYSTLNNVKLQVKQALLSLRAAKENIITAKTALKEAHENFRIANLQYRQQLVTSTEVLDARTYLTQAEMNYYKAIYGYEMYKAQLERAIGKVY